MGTGGALGPQRPLAALQAAHDKQALAVRRLQLRRAQRLLELGQRQEALNR